MKTDRLILVLGDQLNRDSPALATCNREKDRVLMIESREESQRIWSHKARSGLFLAAMRHHCTWLRAQGFKVEYVRIDEPRAESFDSGLRSALRNDTVTQLLMTEAGEFGVQQQIASVCESMGVECQRLADKHFICSNATFSDWRRERKSLVMEHFYRYMRKRHDILMEGGQPAGSSWNFDRRNRKPFGRQGPGMLPTMPAFDPDQITRSALNDVLLHFPDNPGSLTSFAWPVKREQALQLLDDFVAQRLPAFGPFQDAMWTGEPFLHHSALSAALNLKLLHPREVIDAALAAAADGAAPLQSVEGFVR